MLEIEIYNNVQVLLVLLEAVGVPESSAILFSTCSLVRLLVKDERESGWETGLSGVDPPN